MLAWRNGGYALVYYVPADGEGVMREWVSEDVIEHIPEVRDTIRKTLFDAVHDQEESRILEIRKKRMQAQRELEKAEERVKKHKKALKSKKASKAS